MSARLALPGLLSASLRRRQNPAALRADNDRLTLTEYTFQPGVPIKVKPRAHDQLVLFLDDCRYERTDPSSGLKSLRVRKAGEFIWYDRGGDSATVLNVGSAPFRLMLIELK